MAVPGTVWLVGMMGAGKSTVGPALAGRLGRRFVDLDTEIERMAGISIVEIFRRETEAGFRRRERQAIARWAGRQVVVALGGGAVAQPGAAARLRACGVVVYLRASVATLLARLGDCRDRPLLRDLSSEARSARVEALLRERRRAYESASVVLDVDGLTPEVVALRGQRAVMELAAP